MTGKASLGSIYLVAFVDMLGFGTIIPVIRDYTILLVDNTEYLGRDYALYSGVLMSSYSLFQFLLSPLLGKLSDKYGRRPILILSVAGNVFSYFIWAISQSFGLFLISRILSGATGANISVAQSYIADVTTKQDRAKAMGMMGALFGLGFILGPFFGGGTKPSRYYEILLECSKIQPVLHDRCIHNVPFHCKSIMDSLGFKGTGERPIPNQNGKENYQSH